MFTRHSPAPRARSKPSAWFFSFTHVFYLCDHCIEMTDEVAVATSPEAHSADVEYFVRRGMTKGYQLLSLLTPPVYAVFAVSRYGRSHLSVNRILRATWMGGSAGAYAQILSNT